jgi:hypothetical protein
MKHHTSAGAGWGKGINAAELIRFACALNIPGFWWHTAWGQKARLAKPALHARPGECCFLRGVVLCRAIAAGNAWQKIKAWICCMHKQ